jgi:transcriptional regulator with XRE-family HTH domain
MIVRKFRLQRGWSQEQLAHFSGLSVRTIQRIERGQNAGLESLKCLAAVFEVDLSELRQETDMATDTGLTAEEQQVIEQVRDIKGFYTHLAKYVVVIILLFGINLVTSPGYIWVWWVAVGWGIGVVSHGLSVFEVFNIFSPKWEKKQIEKRLGKKL